LPLITLGLASVLLSGCVILREPVEYPAPPPARPAPGATGSVTSSYPQAPAAAPTPAPAPPPATAPPAATRQFHLGAATSALVTQAHRQAAGGDPQLAISTLERAVRIEPDNPLVWIELGEVHESAGRFDQAAGLGHKALQLATGDPRAQSSAWRLIAESLRARGRNGEAAEAQRRADELSPQ
ncbi:MAG TPA: tetratricopeptide repeat protein, partial [Steroidobacteraceae bacterium]|nr:tetratricopeptide repeat protein [Steroidobacteraceae bacterium]